MYEETQGTDYKEFWAQCTPGYQWSQTHLNVKMSSDSSPLHLCTGGFIPFSWRLMGVLPLASMGTRWDPRFVTAL